MATFSRVGLVCALVAVLSIAAPVSAHGALDDALSGTSETNPNAAPHQWRQMWGNSLYPSFVLETPAEASGYFYTVDRSTDTTIDVSQLDLYDRSVKQSGMHFANTLDLDGIYQTDPTGFDGRLIYPGFAFTPHEGVWFWHLRAYAFDQVSSETTYSTVVHHLPFGFDVTDPAKVTGVAVYSSATATTPVSGVLTHSRANLRWNYAEYDKMSGTAYFQVWVDGTRRMPSGPPTSDEPGKSGSGTEGTPWYGPGGIGRLTIEDLSAGRHTIQVSAVDRATNEGLKSTAAVVYIDPDTPTITISSPTSGATVGAKPTLSATAQDLGGVSQVRFYVDGVYKGNVVPSDPTTRLTAKKTVDLSAMTNGTHTVLARAYDVAGRTSEATRSFKLDKTPPKLTNVSGAPSPFYPRKRDGYRDNHVVRFTANKSGTVKLVIKNSAGRTVRTLTKSVKKGSASIVWNGKQSDGVVRRGTYRYYLRLTDGGGQSYKTGTRRASIRFTQVVRVSSSTVKVVQR